MSDDEKPLRERIAARMGLRGAQSAASSSSEKDQRTPPEEQRKKIFRLGETRLGREFVFEQRKTSVKGKGLLDTYLLLENITSEAERQRREFALEAELLRRKAESKAEELLAQYRGNRGNSEMELQIRAGAYVMDSFYPQQKLSSLLQASREFERS